MQLRKIIELTAAGALLLSLAGVLFARECKALRPRETAGSAPVLPPAPPTAPDARQLQNAFSRIAEQSIPAVVVIRTARTVQTWKSAGVVDQLYEYYYPAREQLPTGQGSGFFVNDRGYILTNYHIVRGQDHFRVTLHDGREFDAKLAGSDPLSDLAVLKIDYPGASPCLTFADSEKVKAGHWAIAIGAPFNLPHTVTVGVVSSCHRTVGLNAHENFIQSDASINPGNSGGPLLDIDGHVIGVNDFILTPQGGNIGLGFAIAGNLARDICRDLIRSGHASRAWIGVLLGSVLPAGYRQQHHLPPGVPVVQVLPGSPAEHGGLKPGDLMVQIDGKPVAELNQARLLIFSHRPGDPVTVRIFRNGRERTVRITAGTLPPMAEE